MRSSFEASIRASSDTVLEVLSVALFDDAIHEISLMLTSGPLIRLAKTQLFKDRMQEITSPVVSDSKRSTLATSGSKRSVRTSVLFGQTGSSPV
jgi:hypothetical protein